MSNLLVVEPFALARFSVRSLLLGEGYNVLDYNSRSDWLERRHPGERVDLAIVSADCEFEAAIFLQEARPMMPAVPIVFLLRELRKDTLVWLVRNGAVDFLLKPVPSDRLASHIKALLPPGPTPGQLDDLIRAELARAARGSYPFSLLTISFEMDASSSLLDLERLQTECRCLLRRVDLSTIAGNQLVLQLPFTNRSGLQTVVNKIAGLQPHYPSPFKMGGATFPDESVQAEDLIERAHSRMQHNLHTKEVVDHIREQNRHKGQIELLKAAFGMRRPLRTIANTLQIRSSTDKLGVKLEWDNPIGSKGFELKRFTGNTLDYAKKVFVNRYRDHHARSGMTYTYLVSGISKHTGFPIEASIRVYIGSRN